jgi:hypothetical protein
MKKHYFLAVTLMLLFSTAHAHIDCDKLDEAGEDAQNIVPDFGSGRDIVGQGRLQFYSAPDASCKMDGWFVVPGDTLFAKFTFKGFTKVSFIRMKKTDREVTAWVISSRLRENGKGIVPGHADDDEAVRKK